MDFLLTEWSKQEIKKLGLPSWWPNGSQDSVEMLLHLSTRLHLNFSSLRDGKIEYKPFLVDPDGWSNKEKALLTVLLTSLEQIPEIPDEVMYLKCKYIGKNIAIQLSKRKYLVNCATTRSSTFYGQYLFTTDNQYLENLYEIVCNLCPNNFGEY